MAIYNSENSMVVKITASHKYFKNVLMAGCNFFKYGIYYAKTSLILRMASVSNSSLVA